jgi:hypothetical protein
MRTKTNEPTITKKFHIEVPTHTYGSPVAVFKVFFGKKYLIWKGKSLLQACQQLAENIERYVRLEKDLREDLLYHAANHIRRTRCTKATVKVIGSDFTKDDSDVINGYAVLKCEQDALDECADDPYCLNNNEQAYVPNWIPLKDQEKFLRDYERHHK